MRRILVLFGCIALLQLLVAVDKHAARMKMIVRTAEASTNSIRRQNSTVAAATQTTHVKKNRTFYDLEMKLSFFKATSDSVAKAEAQSATLQQAKDNLGPWSYLCGCNFAKRIGDILIERFYVYRRQNDDGSFDTRLDIYYGETSTNCILFWKPKGYVRGKVTSSMGGYIDSGDALAFPNTNAGGVASHIFEGIYLKDCEAGCYAWTRSWCGL